VREGCYWDFPADQPIRLSGPEEYAEAYRDLFFQAVRRRLRSRFPVAVSVSGGIDSSSILTTALNLRGSGGAEPFPEVSAFSYTLPQGSPSDESAFLDEIERHYPVAIQRIPVAPGNTLDGHRAMVHSIESPFLDELQATLHELFEAVRAGGARVILSGHWADQLLFDQAYLVDLFRQLAWGTIAGHMRQYGYWFNEPDRRVYRRRFGLDLIKYSLPRRLMVRLRARRLRPGREWFTPRFVRLVRHRRISAAPFVSSQPTVHARSLYEQIRSGHHGLCLEWDDKLAAMYGCEMAFPFLDRDLLVFLLNVPGEAVHPEGVPKGILRRAMRGILPDPIRERTWKADFTPVVSAAVREEYETLLALLGSESAGVRAGLFDPAVLAPALAGARDELDRDDYQAAMGLSEVLGLELFLHTFMKV